MNISLTILLANVAATLFMVGLIWTVQAVHYPLFDDVGNQNFVRYHQRHQSNISLVVGPVMLIELITSILLVWYPIQGISKTSVCVGIGLLALIWISTALIQVPCHERLMRGFDHSLHDRLVQSNWIRTIAWTARGALMICMLQSLLSK